MDELMESKAKNPYEQVNDSIITEIIGMSTAQHMGGGENAAEEDSIVDEFASQTMGQSNVISSYAGSKTKFIT
jgi:hypothetical protein